MLSTRICLLIICCFGFTANAVAQRTATGISGSIVDVNGAPVSYAVVELTKQEDPEKIVQKVTSDAHGKFDFSPLDPGEYRVVLSIHGTRTEDNVRVQHGKNVEVRLVYGSVCGDREGVPYSQIKDRSKLIFPIEDALKKTIDHQAVKDSARELVVSLNNLQGLTLSLPNVNFLSEQAIQAKANVETFSYLRVFRITDFGKCLEVSLELHNSSNKPGTTNGLVSGTQFVYEYRYLEGKWKGRFVAISVS